jgi:hypothetical protein
MRFKAVLLAAITSLILLATPLVTTRALVSTLPNRYVKISDSIVGHTNVTYELGFDTTISGTLGSIEAEFCENDPFPGTACTVPPGFSVLGATLLTQAGTSDFSVDIAATNAHKIVFSRVPSVVSGTTFKFELSNVSNASNVGSQYVRIRTFSGAGLGGSVTDEAGLAYATKGNVGISTIVPQHLDFCIGIVIANDDCSNVVGDTINFGILTTTKELSATSQIVAATNADNGYSVIVSGNSLTSGNNVLKAMNNLTASAPGTNQFGINLRKNTNPSSGTDPTGAGIAAISSNYSVPDNFIFNSGDQVISATSADHFRKFTATYIVNIDKNQPAGYYATTLTYTAIGNF